MSKLSYRKGINPPKVWFAVGKGNKELEAGLIFLKKLLDKRGNLWYTTRVGGGIPVKARARA